MFVCFYCCFSECCSVLTVTIWQPGFDLPRQQWSLLNRFRTEQGHCGACRRKWRLTDPDLCPCGETQTMSYIVESCPLTKLNGSLSRLHSADEDAVSWLTSYGSWHTYEKKKKMVQCTNFCSPLTNIHHTIQPFISCCYFDRYKCVGVFWYLFGGRYSKISCWTDRMSSFLRSVDPLSVCGHYTESDRKLK